MSRSYGKIPRGGRKDQPAAPADLQINITGRHTLEQLSMELQKAIAQLQEQHVYGVQKVRIRLEALDTKGELIALYDEDGRPIPLIQIPPLKAEPPYRGD